MPRRKVSLSALFNYCQQNKLPLAFYKLPQTNTIHIIAQRHSRLHTLKLHEDYSNQKGFLCSPFIENGRFKKFIIEPDILTTSESIPSLDFASFSPHKKSYNKTIAEPAMATKKLHKQYVLNIRSEIQSGHFAKIVAARVAKFRKPDGFDVANYYQKVCKKYRNAFVSLVYTPQYGLWIGASPEVLLQVQDKVFTTYSLAGTQKNAGSQTPVSWGNKEKEEQQLVTGYILTAFKKVAKQKPRITGPQTVVAGNLLHLLTTFAYTGIPKNNWQKIVEALHPTPAVAGLPKTKAIKFIQQHEYTERGYYSGFLGPVNINGEVRLFVNLRCMQVLEKHLALYVGGGITADSIPAKEWDETQLKTHTLLSVL